MKSTYVGGVPPGKTTCSSNLASSSPSFCIISLLCVDDGDDKSDAVWPTAGATPGTVVSSCGGDDGIDCNAVVLSAGSGVTTGAAFSAGLLTCDDNTPAAVPSGCGRCIAEPAVSAGSAEAGMLSASGVGTTMAAASLCSGDDRIAKNSAMLSASVFGNVADDNSPAAVSTASVDVEPSSPTVVCPSSGTVGDDACIVKPTSTIVVCPGIDAAGDDTGTVEPAGDVKPTSTIVVCPGIDAAGDNTGTV